MGFLKKNNIKYFSSVFRSYIIYLIDYTSKKNKPVLIWDYTRSKNWANFILYKNTVLLYKINKLNKKK